MSHGSFFIGSYVISIELREPKRDASETSIVFKPCQGPCGGIAPDGGVRHAGGVLSPAELRRTRIAELRAAVIRAHPDHGGTTATLQEALVALRAELQREAPPSVASEVPPPPPARRPRATPPSSQSTVRGAAVGLLKTAFWVYGVAMPIILGLTLLIARANASLIGS
jgi:hypothetical protein